MIETDGTQKREVYVEKEKTSHAWVWGLVAIVVLLVLFFILGGGSLFGGSSSGTSNTSGGQLPSIPTQSSGQ